MWFEWDEAKNWRNQRKHGVSFEMAQQVFDDPNCIIEPSYDDPETGEPRWKAIGITREPPLVLLVIHVYRYPEWQTRESDEAPEEIIRILSARAASAGEVRRSQKL